ncbi:Potassium efflux system KefA precursor [Jannaschia seosinensis]|uniref:Potassium efflux system KefA n=1 Tax=Jannaschia seosinensis TaxID=313367 RepID=A0A0M7BDA3_9RHOB|nr:mechanosensitive ion channel family protein [Jannaschia seosinensis]CUH40048.1 Potassium efflux system KefA precursor [Jannaschia seosinensis]
MPHRQMFLAILLSFLAFAMPAAAQEEGFFEIERLNAGLGSPPDIVDRRSPRATIETLLRAAEVGEWDAAAHLLDLRGLSPEAQRERGAILAAQLYTVLERRVVFDWSQLLSRPDALQVTGGDQAAQAGEPRRSILLRDLELEPVPAEIRLDRLKPLNADPVWVFPRSTVEDIPALYERHGPTAFEAALPQALRNKAFWDLMWWELIGLPLMILTAFAVGFTVNRLVKRIGRAFPGRIAGAVIQAVASPLVIVSVTVLLWLSTRYIFIFSGRIDLFLSPIIVTGYVTALLLLIVNVVEVLLDELISPGEDIDLTRRERDESRTLATKLNAGKRILVVVVFLIGVGFVMASADIFRSLGLSLLASAGVLTLIAGFAARSLLGNVIASLQIALNQSARVGDRVVYKDVLAHVERINMTFVQLRGWDGTRLIVPVEEFISETFSNWSITDPAMTRILKFKLDPRADVERLREIFTEVLDRLDDTDLGEELGDRSSAKVSVAGQDVFGIDVWFFVPCRDPNTSWEVACVVREDMIRRAGEIEDAPEHPIFPQAVAAEAA